MSDIVDRLVRFAGGNVCISTDTEVEAAVEIDRLRAEIEKLRAALKPFADIAKQTEHWSGPPVSVPLYVIRAAAAALNAENESHNLRNERTQ